MNQFCFGFRIRHPPRAFVSRRYNQETAKFLYLTDNDIIPGVKVQYSIVSICSKINSPLICNRTK